MILLLDHDDSFVYNLARYVEELGVEARVVRARTTSLADISVMRPERIILSPGPCTPNECPLAETVILQLGPMTPILGVCLGHQCIAQAYGGTIVRARAPRHGMTSMIEHDGRGVFTGIESPFVATRYHSLVMSLEHLPEVLEITASADDGEIMGVRHKVHPVEGVQFHPESVLTEHGHQLLENFLRPVAR